MMHAQSTEQSVKIVLVGDTGVGKSCILHSYIENRFYNEYITTIGVDFRTRRIQVDDRWVKLQIWDTAGQERFRSLTSNYFRGADILCLVYDITHRESFHNLKYWVNTARNSLQNRGLFLVIGNKVDKTVEREISQEEAGEFAATLSAGFFEVSAKTLSNVHQVFDFMAESVVRQKQIEQKQEQEKEALILSESVNKSSQGFWRWC